MPWKCPACDTSIRHDGDRPDPHRIYRCSVCRLELAINETTNLMEIAPLRESASDMRKRRPPLE